MTTTRTDPPPASSTSTVRQPDRRLGAVASIAGGLALLTSFVVLPGPDVADIHRSGWVPGHFLSAVAFLLLAIGLPVICARLGPRLGIAGLVGYVAVETRCVLSTGSHLYSLWILPTLASHHDLHRQLVDDGRLASIYAGHGDVVNVVLGAGMLGLAVALARSGSGMRVVAALTALAAVAESVSNPLSLLLLAIVGIWLGMRLLYRGDVSTTLRRR